MQTSLIDINSSTNGRKRRIEKDITKGDLQAAIHGDKEKSRHGDPQTGEPRWKYTHKEVGILFITDSTSTNEINSFAIELELEDVKISPRRLIQYREAKKRIAADPSIITSCTVLIIDKSASMKLSDTNGHKSRARGVYYSLAEEFVATQLDDIHSNTFGGKNVSFTDEVTLIEMKDGPTVVFENEPITWELYNTFVEISKRKDARSHGNYYPSFVAAFDCLRQNDHPACALSLFFLTDGRPSDHTTTGGKKKHSSFPSNLLDLIVSSSQPLGHRFTFTAVGYGAAEADFDLLKSLVQVAKSAGCQGMFSAGSLDPEDLGRVLRSVITSTTSMRSLLSRIQVDPTKTKTVTTKTNAAALSNYFFPWDWDIYKTNCERYERYYKQEQHAFIPTWKPVPFMSPEASGFAVRKQFSVRVLSVSCSR